MIGVKVGREKRRRGLEEELTPEQTLRPKHKTDDRWESERRKRQEAQRAAEEEPER